MGNLAYRIKKRRLDLGLSPKQVAGKLEVPLSSYIEWENGRKITGEEVYPKMSSALGLSLSELILGKETDVNKELLSIEKSIHEIRSLI